MSKFIQVFTLLNVLLLLSGGDSRRIRVRPQRPVVEEEPSDQEEQPQRVEYYAAESQEAQPEPQQKLVLLTNEGEVLNGLYGRTLERTGTDPQYPRVIQRQGLVAQPRPTRVKETAKEPPVQTIRNYSKVNDDGSFTFGYEAADGSFKEETRGTDCVVRGKYGYVDPDGNKREFTYVSGNPCDPNAPNQEEEEDEKEDSDESGEENIPQNIPKRPLRPVRPISKPLLGRPATTLFQQDFNTVHPESGLVSEDRSQQQPQIYLHPAPAPTPAPVGLPIPVQPAVAAPAPARIRGRVPNRPVSVQLPVPSEKPESVVRVTPRPVTPPTPATLPATTYRPQLLVSVTPRPNVVLTKHTTLAQSTPIAASPSPIGALDFEEELKRFQLENNVVTTPKTLSPPTTLKADPQTVPSGQPVYTSELVFDPATGQYNTVLYQQIPKTTADITLKTRLPQLVAPPQPQPQRPAPVRQHPSNLLQQQIFEQQKQVLFQQSQDLYNQQRNQLQAQHHRFQPAFTPTTIQYQPLASTVAPTAAKPLATGPQKFENAEPPQRVVSRPYNPQHFYYFAPQIDVQSQALAAGQIDAFLRGHNYHY